MVGGLAEIAAGSIAMGLGGYLAARTDAQHYEAEEKRERWEIENMRDHEVVEITEIFRGYGLKGTELTTVIDAITSDPKQWTDFMMRFELGLEKPDPKRAPISAGTIAVSYLVGGLIPLIPYMLTSQMSDALKVSVETTGVALLIFGAVKGHFTGLNKFVSAGQTLLVGGLAAATAFWLAHLFG